jgi:peroxygenase
VTTALTLSVCLFSVLERAGAEAEWKILYSLGKDGDGLLRKDVARSVYDGTLFHRLAPRWKSPDSDMERS